MDLDALDDFNTLNHLIARSAGQSIDEIPSMRLFGHPLVVGAAVNSSCAEDIEPVSFYATVQLKLGAGADSGLNISEDEAARDLKLMTHWRAASFLFSVGVDGDGGAYEIGVD
jgi:hypothetical protein